MDVWLSPVLRIVFGLVSHIAGGELLVRGASRLVTEGEAAFRIHKSDLSLRRIWHQKQGRVLAHILVCFMAYVLWKKLAAVCEKAGLGHEPRRGLDELSHIGRIDVLLPTRNGPTLRRRGITKPTDH